MNQSTTSLRQTFPNKYEVPAALITSTILLFLGLLLPSMTLQELVFWRTTFSILTGIESLMKEGHILLGLIILLFSIIFPMGKLTALFLIWFRKMPDEIRNHYVYWLTVLGKWSMLDVFVVAVTIVITKISGFANATAHIGIYLFALSVIITMITTERIERLIKSSQEKLQG